MNIEGQVASFYGGDGGALAWTGSVGERLLAMSSDCYVFDFFRSVQEGFFELIKKVRLSLKGQGIATVVTCFGPRTAIIATNGETFITLHDADYSNTNPWNVLDRGISIKGYGDYEIITQLHTYLDESIKESLIPSVVWEYMVGNDRKNQSIRIARAKPIFSEFYPWIGCGVHEYFDRYLASESSILVLLGEAGTAKTSFIRSMIWHAGLKTMFTYDEKLLVSDSMFVDFITGTSELLVVEDADLFLTDREHGANKVMSKFLNISDGLAAGKRKKKIIFTANILEPTRIDSALLRPGRCYECLPFRRLTYTEACAAAAAGAIPAPKEDRYYTLAELFSLAKNEPTSVTPEKVGFSR
jgi:hypothetical protein